MYFGAHVSIAGGVFNAPLNAAALGCEVFQIFSRSPQGGFVPKLTTEVLEMFQQNCRLTGQVEWYVHTPYFINFASLDKRIYGGSIAVIKQELERGTKLAAKYVMTHLGSYKDSGQEKGLELVVAGLEQALNGYDGPTELLIEIAAGAGSVIGGTFEDVAAIIFHPKLKKYNLAVCYDTQHGFAGGYDIRSVEAVAKTLQQFDAVIGLDKLKMFHCNDSKVEFHTNRDRHEHIGEGHIGLAGFKALLTNPNLQSKNFILETEHDKVVSDLKKLKKIRG